MSVALYACPACLETITERVWVDGRWLCAACARPASTPTGVPIAWCRTCARRHPATRRHCSACGRPSLFIRPAGVCITCDPVGSDR